MKFEVCPLCGGEPSPSYKLCFHCTNCEYVQCEVEGLARAREDFAREREEMESERE